MYRMDLTRESSILFMVHEDEFPASLLLLSTTDSVASWARRFSRFHPMALSPSPLLGSETSVPVHAPAAACTRQAQTLGWAVVHKNTLTRARMNQTRGAT